MKLILNANALRLPITSNTVQCVVTSPPYWGLRDYGVSGQLGSEPIHDCAGWVTGQSCGECFVCHMRQVFAEVWRVLRPDGTLWLNFGDSYASDTKGSGGPSDKQDSNAGSRYDPHKLNLTGGLKPKDLVGIPWRVALALQADGWYLRSDIIWHKPNPMPESVTDRPTKSHEYLFLLTKSARYFYDGIAVQEPVEQSSIRRARRGVSDNHKNADGAPGQTPHTMSQPRENDADRDVSQFRNRRTVWTIPSAPYSGAHFATFPPKLVEPCILAGTSARGQCPTCGAPWARVVEVGELIKNGCSGNTAPPQSGKALVENETMQSGFARSGLIPGMTHKRTTTGWQPTCQCPEAEPVPQIVLDPFSGTATVGKVAIAHRRRYIGTELNPDYIDLSRERTANTQIKLGV